MGALKKIFGTHSERELKRIYPIVDKVESYQEEMGKLSDDELFRLRYQAREDQLRQQWDMEYYYNTKFAEMEEQNAAMAKQNAAITAEKDAMAKRIAELEAQLRDSQSTDK